MSFNLKSVPTTNKQLSYKLMPPGSYPGRLVQVIGLGMQPNRFNPEEPPHTKVMFTYEFADEFMLDDDGQEMKDKPRWLSEDHPLHNLSATKATSTKRYNAFDPNGVHEGDLEKCLGAPIMITVINNAGKGKNLGKTYENIAGVTAMREKDAQKLPALVNAPRIFDFYEPDLQVFRELAEFTKDRIKSALDFGGSKLEAMLKESGVNLPPKQELAKELDDTNPY